MIQSFYCSRYSYINFQLFRKSLKKHVNAVLSALGDPPAYDLAPAADLAAHKLATKTVQLQGNNTQAPGKLCITNVTFALISFCQTSFIVAIQVGPVMNQTENSPLLHMEEVKSLCPAEIISFQHLVSSENRTHFKSEEHQRECQYRGTWSCRYEKRCAVVKLQSECNSSFNVSLSFTESTQLDLHVTNWTAGESMDAGTNNYILVM